MPSGFDFSVVVFPEEKTLNRELSYIKAALLYSDEVRLISPTIFNFIKRYEWAENMNHDTLIKASVAILDAIEVDEIRSMDIALSAIKTKGFRNMLNARLEKDDLKKQLINGMLNINESAFNAFVRRDYPEIMKLLRSKQLVIESFTYPIEDYDIFEQEFFEKVEHAISGKGYPVFDNSTNQVLKKAVESRVFEISDSEFRRVAHANASDTIIQKLPAFEMATLDELIDIKRELYNHLIRFRGKMVGFTDAIKTLPWDKDFSYDCDMLYTQEIAPAVADIQEAVRDNNVMKNLTSKFTSDDDALKTLGFLSICVAAPGVLPGFAGIDLASLLAGGSLAIAKVAQSIKEFKDNKKEIQHNDLYFYYRAGEMLKKHTH
jgi:hypothetical protein